MIVGIVGSDDRAQAIGRLIKSGGHTVTFGDPCSKEDAARAAAALQTKGELPYSQAAKAEVMVLAVPEKHVDPAITAVGSGSDAVFIDAVEDEHNIGSRSGAECLAHKLDTHRVVRALINIPQSGSNIEICGDDPNAKIVVERLLESCGCRARDLGPLATARELEAPAVAA
ncbi:MAG: NAD(P)-binding domain-containing protein [Candidatus Eremiobacteraeota bacterium]|nr:NAD(P)-binding domain-containing protein [Candidatus Eremiobacteraeota bacterium]